MNGTKNSFHRQMQADLTQIRMIEIYELIGFAFVVLLLIAVTIYRIACFLKRSKTVLDILVATKKDYQKRGYKYYRQLYRQFVLIVSANKDN
jgi:hypothetical protein